MDMTATATSGEEGNQASSSSSSSSTSSSAASQLLSSGVRRLRASTTLAEGSAGHDFATKLLEKPHLLTELQREQLLRQVGGGGGTQQEQQQQQALGQQGQQQPQQQQPLHQKPPAAAAAATAALPVHSFGRCRSNMPTAPTGGQVAVMRDYRFCIAMENSISEDYVTEKVYAALDAGCLPIYYGAPNGLDFVPVPESVIDYRALGGTPEALMAEIARLNADEQAYEAKMAWRKTGPAGWSPKFLALRERANEMSGQCAVCLKVAEALERNREKEEQEEEMRKKSGGGPSSGSATSGSAAATTTTAAKTTANAAASASASALPVNHMAASRRFIDGLEEQEVLAAAAAERGEVRM